MSRFHFSCKAAALPMVAGLAAILMTGVSSLPALAQSSPGVSVASDSLAQGAKSFIDRLAGQAIAFLSDKTITDEQKRGHFRKLLIDDYDMPTIGRFALGPAWNQLSPAQKQEYQSDFQEMIVRLYSARFQNYNGQSLKTTASHVDPQTPGDVIIDSLIIPADNNSSPIQVDWRVRQKGGQYRVVDIVIEGVSMALTQRSDFSAAIQQNGGDIDGFLKQLRAKADGSVPVQPGSLGGH